MAATWLVPPSFLRPMTPHLPGRTFTALRARLPITCWPPSATFLPALSENETRALEEGDDFLIFGNDFCGDRARRSRAAGAQGPEPQPQKKGGSLCLCSHAPGSRRCGNRARDRPRRRALGA